MFRFMTATTLVLTAAFYQQSGGADFEPWERELPDYVRTEAPTPYTLARTDTGASGAAMAAQAATRPAVFVSSSQPEAAPVRLASIAGQNDSGLDPALDGMRFATVTNASLPADGGLPQSSTRREVRPEAAQQMTPTTEERQAVLRGTLPTTATDAPEVSAADAPERDLRQVSGDRVNLRAGPGTSYGVLATLDEGAEVEVIDTNNGWVKLKTADSGRIGWMADWLVSAAK